MNKQNNQDDLKELVAGVGILFGLIMLVFNVTSDYQEVNLTNNSFEYAIDINGTGTNSVRVFYTDPVSGPWMDEKW